MTSFFNGLVVGADDSNPNPNEVNLKRNRASRTIHTSFKSRNRNSYELDAVQG